MKIPDYLHRYCDDYTEDTAELQLHATLTFEPDWSHIYDNQGQCIGAFMSWYICLGGTREGTAADGGAKQHCCRIHTSKDLTIKCSMYGKFPRPSWHCSCLKRYNASWGQLVQFKQTNTAGQQEEFYMRADCFWDVEDVRAAWTRQE